MNIKDIDEEIATLVREKHLLNLSINRTEDENAKREMKKRIIMINSLIRKAKLKYDEVEKEKEEWIYIQRRKYGLLIQERIWEKVKK